MPVRFFQDDDGGYESWLAAHPSGWVVNARRRPSPAYLKLHEATCPTISQLQTCYSRWTTGEYIKVCAEHREELDAWAQHAFGAGLQDGCHCVHRTSGTHTARPGRADPLSRATLPTPAPVVADSEGFQTVETATIIPYPPKGQSLLHAQAQLRSVLAGLTAQPGQLLHGIIEGPEVAGTDLDNALLYNIGGRVSAATRYGVALERRVFRSSTASTRYRYRLTSDPAAGTVDGEPIVEFNQVPLSLPPWNWHNVWAAMRTSDAVTVLSSAPRGGLGLHLRVGAPGLARSANGSFVKTLVDGVVTALHAHGDASTADDIADRLAAKLTLPARDISGLLVNQQQAALGVCHRLVVPHGNDVQCHPQDGRISVLRIEIDRTAASCNLSGRLVSTSRV